MCTPFKISQSPFLKYQFCLISVVLLTMLVVTLVGQTMSEGVVSFKRDPFTASVGSHIMQPKQVSGALCF